MTRLAELQQNFQTYLLDPELTDNPQIDWINNSGRATPERQLSIYSVGYRLRLKEVLENDYPAMLTTLGEEQFEQLADAYINAHPSHYFSLREFGKHFPTYISTLHFMEDIPWITQLALFEWNLGQAFDSGNSEVLTEQELSLIVPEDWPTLKFIIHPSVHRMDFDWNIPEIWKNLTSDTPSLIPAVKTPVQAWVIWRSNLITQFRSIEPDEQQALDALIKNTNFEGICEILVPFILLDDIPLRAATLLKTWVSQGLISRIA